MRRRNATVARQGESLSRCAIEKFRIGLCYVSNCIYCEARCIGKGIRQSLVIFTGPWLFKHSYACTTCIRLFLMFPTLFRVCCVWGTQHLTRLRELLGVTSMIDIALWIYNRIRLYVRKKKH